MPLLQERYHGTTAFCSRMDPEVKPDLSCLEENLFSFAFQSVINFFGNEFGQVGPIRIHSLHGITLLHGTGFGGSGIDNFGAFGIINSHIFFFSHIEKFLHDRTPVYGCLQTPGPRFMKSNSNIQAEKCKL